MGLTGPIASAVPAFTAVPRVPSLLFDMELEEGMTSCHASEELSISVVEQELRNFLLPGCPAALQLATDVDATIRAQQQQLSTSAATADEPPPPTTNGHHQQPDVPALARSLTRQGYLACMRRAVGGGEGPSCLQNLRHNFLSISTPGSDGTDGTTFVVDPCFTEQFLIAKPTQRYTTILACLPSILIIPEDRLAPLVNFLCAELAAAFKASSTVVPPWRQASSVLSKWKPRNSIDETYSPSPRARSGAQAEPTPQPPAAGGAAQAAAPSAARQARRASWCRDAGAPDAELDALFPPPAQAASAAAASPAVLVSATQHTRVTVGFTGSKINSSGLSLLTGLLHSS